MNSFVALVRVNFLALLNMFGGVRRKQTKKTHSGMGVLVLLIVLALYISGLYSFLFAQFMAPMGQLSLMLALMSVIAVAFALIMTAFGSGGIIFGGKDMDFMLSLPISAFSVMLSKVLALYLENLLITLFMMLPCGAIYLYHGGAGGVSFVIMLLVQTLFFSLIPTIFAMLIGLFMAWLQSRLGGKAWVSNLAYLVFFVVLMALGFRLNIVLMKGMASVDSMEHMFDTLLYPFGLYRDAILGNLDSAMLFPVITLVPFLVLVYLFSLNYKKILSRMMSHANRSDYKMESLRTSGPFLALFKKELGRFWGTPIYLFNTGIGVLIVIGASIYACVQKDNLQNVLGQMGELSPFLLVSLIAAFCFSLTSPACVSISLEGKTLWILKEAPIPAKTILLAKALLNILLIAVPSVVCLPLVWYAFRFTAGELLILGMLCLSLVLFVPAFGLWINLMFPKMDGTNDTLIVKQSKSSFISIMSGMALVSFGSWLYTRIAQSISEQSYILICSAILGLAGILLFVWLFRKGEKYLLEL